MSTRELPVDREELRRYQISLANRDFCSHLLIPLEKCRRETAFSMSKCHHQLHAYEQCQYDEYQKSVKAALTQK
ncbi:NADH dehydrogenase ubiquinone 1 beta subcomplex subunit 7 [Hondaea fermentalgiana]|uniref:NADH dehydrogenase [ubiquinone] 1 beta subcomplex subunit 7 n=1 Tax=Hondaea fermentalgiana TaxID=2315210 RepID=A0A2R5H1R9_9STRA|nr:NADH dehydrogenase ubiquinone 1 beta subcomplex subunit 7 [Hondaea fermentalgiana]|eukprot:GBG34761.1 NADH dehydrogenase ubiquinone 1 beta subcomplex subunit 7 [Hondaea fermentalgiana]